MTEAAFAHPAFAPYRWRLEANVLPTVEVLDAWARQAALALPDGRALRFVEGRAGGALAYESAIAAGQIRVRRDSLHDVLNALVWLAFPRTKAALNARHVGDRASATPNARSRARDAATLLDESGMILACANGDLVTLLREHAWRELFVARAEAVARDMRPLVIGHGLLAKLVAPYRAITSRTLVVAIDPATLAEGDAGQAVLDAATAEAIADPAWVPERLLALPVAALPGWDREKLGERLFDDVRVFRPLP